MNGRNIVCAIISGAVSIIRYRAAIIYWTKDDLGELDWRTRKLLTIYRPLHPQADVDRLYVKRSGEGRGLLSVEDCVDIKTNNFFLNVKANDERLFKAAKDENMLDEGKTREGIIAERLDRNKVKVFHGQYMRGSEEFRDLAS